MKKLLAIALLSLAALAAHAQTVTNVTWRIQVETGTVGGSTNTVTTNFRFDYGNAKELSFINGYVLAWGVYKANGGVNSLGDWLKQDVKDRAKSYADAKLAVDNATLLAKLTSLLTQNADLLSAGDLSSLNSIAAKAP